MPNNRKNKKKYMTWNMQGKWCEASKSKYEIIMDFIKKGYSVIALQEAGPNVPLPNTTRINEINLTNPDGISNALLSAYNWRIGSTRSETRGQNIFQYFLNWDEGGHRVNNSIVSTVEPDEVIILQRPQTWYEYWTGTQPKSRPILGIRIGDDYIFNIHATADGGSNAPALVKLVREFMDGRPDAKSWIILGDFNRDPSSLEKALDRMTKRKIKIKSPKNPTHHSPSTSHTDRVLDYAVVDSETARQMEVLEFPQNIFSDHSWVGFIMMLLEEEEGEREKQKMEYEENVKRTKKEDSHEEKEKEDDLEGGQQATEALVGVVNGLLNDFGINANINSSSIADLLPGLNIRISSSSGTTSNGPCPLCGGYHGAGGFNIQTQNSYTKKM